MYLINRFLFRLVGCYLILRLTPDLTMRCNECLAVISIEQRRDIKNSQLTALSISK